MDINLTFLCMSKNGMKVMYDPADSHTATHFDYKTTLMGLAIEQLEKQVLEQPTMNLEIDTGKIIGESDIVTIGESDSIIYAIRKNREDQGYVPFVKNREPEPCDLVSVSLQKIDDTTYELLSAWIGELESPPFPQMVNRTNESTPYWRSHAFIWGSQEIIPNTEIQECPW